MRRVAAPGRRRRGCPVRDHFDLQDILERVSTTIDRTSTYLPRFGGYPPRLRTALDRVLEGQNEFLTSPKVASFHNVWMECHEDYLLTLGISREEEGSY